MSDRRDDDRLEENLCTHIFAASAAMVGVCATVLGLFRAVGTLDEALTIGDELLALDAIAFLISCIVSYTALRQRDRRRRRVLERVADGCFLTALSVLVVVTGLMAYELR